MWLYFLVVSPIPPFLHQTGNPVRAKVLSPGRARAFRWRLRTASRGSCIVKPFRYPSLSGIRHGYRWLKMPEPIPRFEQGSTSHRSSPPSGFPCRACIPASSPSPPETARVSAISTQIVPGPLLKVAWTRFCAILVFFLLT